jgi:cystathionine beta-lyase/cystathionine gamma-synthase
MDGEEKPASFESTLSPRILYRSLPMNPIDDPKASGLHEHTRLAQAGSRWCSHTGAVSMPIYKSATFRHPGVGQSTGFDYSRTSNPTRKELETVLAAMEGAERALAFSTGMAAVDCVLRLFKPGDVIQVIEDLYGGTWRIMENLFRPWGLDIRYIDPLTVTDGKLGPHLLPESKGLFIESPTNPVMRVFDLRESVQAAHALGQIVIVDNTFQAFLCKPLELGADVVLFSGTKYLGGHNDLLCGVLAARTPELAERLGWLQNTTGAVLGPEDSWLLLRSLKTLPLRLARQEENASALAHWLWAHPRVVKVHYPGLADHPGHALHRSQSNGFGGMLSIEVDDPALVKQILERVKVWMYAESLGGVESLITFPVLQTHADIAVEVRERLGVNDRLLRLSVGIEHIDDLVADLAQALEV